MSQQMHVSRPFLKKAAVALTGLISFLLLAFFVLPSTYTQSYTRGKIEDLLSQQLGRKVLVAGAVLVDWHWPAPGIQAEKVQIANLPGSKEPYLLDVEKIDFTPRVWQFLTGRFDVSDISVFHPQLFLERSAAGKENWDSAIVTDSGTIENLPAPDTMNVLPLIGSLRVSGGRISYKDIPRGIVMMLDLDTVNGKGLSTDESFVLTGGGTIEGQKFSLKASGGALGLLQHTRQEFPLSFEIAEHDSTLSVDGAFTDPAHLRGLNATLRLAGHNLADLFYLMHIPFPPTPPYELKGQLKKDDDYWTFRKFSGSVGHSDLSGNAVYNANGKRPLLSGDMFSKRLDVADLGGLIGLSPTAPETAGKRKKVLPDVPLDLKRLQAGDMDINLKAKELNAPGWPLSEMQTHIRLRNGLLDLQPLQFGAADGVVEGFVQLDGRQKTPQVKMDLSLKQLSLRRFFPGASFDDFSKGFFNGRIQLQGPGYSLAQALGNSNGQIEFYVVGGKISKALIESASPGLAELSPLLGRDKTTDVRCGIGAFNVSDGQLKSRTFMLDTSHTRLEGHAKVNLRKETIDASFYAIPKDLKLFSMHPKILISGKMNDPSLSVDWTSSGGKAVGTLLLAGLFPPAALLSFVEPGAGESSACNQLMNAARDPPQTPVKNH